MKLTVKPLKQKDAGRGLAAVDRRLTILVQLREEQARMAAADDPGHVGKCRVIEVLGDHRHCIGAHDPPDGSVDLSEN